MIESPDGFIIVDSPSMADRTTIHLGGTALAEVRVSNVASLEKIPGLLSRIGGRICIMGEGSNIIAKEGKLPVVLVSLAPVEAPCVVEDKGGSVLLRVSAGMRLPALLAHTSTMGLSGLEGLCGIPGSVGGAVSMNAGSYGVETANLVRSVQLFSPLVGLAERDIDAFDIGYRKCSLRGHSGWFVISAVTFELTKGNKTHIRNAMREVYLKKQASQPVTAWSAGCAFKNPAPDAPAGKLLEEAGLRGMRIGNISFSSVHANFLVNEGNGTFEQAIDLIEMARDKVLKHSGHALELEVQIWP